MRNISVLFFVLVICPFALSQSVSMIQQSQEGKTVLDNLLLQVTMKGSELNINSLKAGLTNIETMIRSDLKTRGVAQEQIKTSCDKELKDTAGALADIIKRNLVQARNVSMKEKEIVHLKRVQDLASEDNDIAASFYTMTVQNKKAWVIFWKTLQADTEMAGELLTKIELELNAVHAKAAQTAFVELPASYTYALMQVREQFAGMFTELHGLKPVITNLLAIAADPTKMNDDEVRAKMQGIIGNTKEYLNDLHDRFVEENEHQESLFENLVTSYTSKKESMAKILKAGEEAHENAEKEVIYLRLSEESSELLVTMADKVTLAVSSECHVHADHHKYVDEVDQRMLDVVDQVRIIANESFPEIASFFIERMA